MYHSCSFIGLFCKRDLYTSVNHGHQLPFITHLKGAVVDTCLSLCVYLSISTMMPSVSLSLPLMSTHINTCGAISLSLSPSHVNTYQTCEAKSLSLSRSLSLSSRSRSLARRHMPDSCNTHCNTHCNRHCNIYCNTHTLSRS